MALALTIFAGAVLASFAVDAQQRNIVVIMTDDQDVGKVTVMSNTNNLLGNAGTTFLNSFAEYSLCCPSRATFLTGQHARNHGVIHNVFFHNGGYKKLDHTNTLAVWLQAAGYNTVHIGKYLNQYGTSGVPRETIPPGWTEWYGTPDPDAYRYYDYSINENGTLVAYGSAEADYQTDVYVRKATDFIARMATSTVPFFMWFAPLAPHDDGGSPGPAPAPRHDGLFANEPLPQPPSFNEADVSDKPAAIANLRLLSPTKVDVITKRHRRKLEALLAVDEGVKAIVDALQAAGKLDNTVIVFTSDNGYMQGEHRIAMGKIHLYEESIRVPLIIRYPGLPAGGTRTELVSNIDLAPTIVEIAGATAGRVMDGRSLVSLLNGTATQWRNHLFIEATWKKAVQGTVTEQLEFQAVRTQQHFYGEHYTGERELYNFADDACHAADPYQLENQQANPCYSQTIIDLSAELNALRTCTGNACFR